MAKFNEANKILEEIGELLLKNESSIVELFNRFKIIFDETRKRIVNNEAKSNNFISNMINYYNIRNQTIINDLVIFFKIKKYELDINSIIFFFKYFRTDDKKWNKSSEKYENLSSRDFPEIKEILMELKRNGIYDYQDRRECNEIFICLYKKKKMQLNYY